MFFLMASNASTVNTMESLNPCCAQWKTRYSKLEEKRKALRQGVEILKGQVDRLQLENVDLKKAFDEDRARLQVLEKEKGEELSLRISLEKEIAGLKSEVSSVKPEVASGNVDFDKEATHLRTCISEKDMEIDRLKHLLADEITRVDIERKTAELERTIAAELQKSLENEKSKADEARKMADAAAKKAEDFRVQLETSKNEVEKTNLKWEEVNRNLEAEKQKAIKEKRFCDEKRVQEEECHANNLLKQLEEEKQKVEKLHKEMFEIMSYKRSADTSELDEVKRKLEAEKKIVAKEKKHVEEERLRVIELKVIAEANEKLLSEEKCRADKLLRQLEDEKQKIEKLQRELQETQSSQKAVDSSDLDELKRKLEEEKEKVVLEQRCAEELKARVVEQIKIADANMKWGSDEKSRADKLLVQLEEGKRKAEKMQREMQEMMSSQKAAYSSELDKVSRNFEAEKRKVAMERKRGDLEMSRREEQKKLADASIKDALEEKCRADKLSKELESSRAVIENLKRELKKVNDMLEAERKEAARERTRADMQKLKSEEQGKIAVANEKRAVEEKHRGDNLFLELENARQKLHDMEHKLNEVNLSRGLGRTSNMAPAVKEQASRVNLLQEQLKFEKKRVKHAKEVAKLEKGRNSILQQELQRLKQDFQCLLDHLGMLSDSFGARNGWTKVPKKSSPSQMHFHGDNELRMSSLSSKDASCLFKPDMRLVQAGLCMESISGMENDQDPLQGGSRGDTIPTSALNSNTASFSDEQLVGSQEKVAGSPNISAGLTVENPNQQVTMLRGSNECYKRNNGEKVFSVGDHSIRSPVETVNGHSRKRRKILDEFESIKYMHLEGKSIFQEAEKKLFALQNTLLQPMMNEQIEKENLPLPVNNTRLCGNSDWSSKERNLLHEPDVIFQQADDSNVQIEVDKVFVPSATEKRDSSQPLPVLERDRIRHGEDAGTSFEQAINGDYMKLLDLDNTVAEECFKLAMQTPLSPILPEFDLLETLSVPLSGNNEARHQHAFQAHNENQLGVVLFSDLEDVGSITRIYGATKTSGAQCLFLQTNLSMQDILGALQLEKDLRPREKACVLFSLILLNFSVVSFSKSVNFHIQEQMDSFSAHIQSVLSISDMRDLFAKICDLGELLALSEDFLLNRKIVSNYVTYELLDGCGSSIEILQEGEKVVLWKQMASTDLVVAGSIIFASISKAVGHTGFVCEASLKILQVDRTDFSLALSILHSFAYVCGDDYFTISNCSLVMKVVSSVVTFIESFLAKNSNKNLQLRDNTRHQFKPCARCPFSKGSVSLVDVSSELLEELQRHILSQNSTKLDHLSNRETLSCILADVLSSLELITSIMVPNGWDLVRDKIVPKLVKMLKSSHQDGVFSTALVVLLSDIGRLGVEACGYDDIGVEDIKRQLLGVLYQTAASKCDTTLPMAIVYGLIGLYPKGHEMFLKGNLELPLEGHSASASSDIVSKFLSSLSSEQITSLAGLVNPDIRVAA